MCPGEPPESSQPCPQPTPASAWVMPRSAWPLAVNCPGWVSSHGTVGTRTERRRPERVPPTPGGTACPHSCDHLGTFSSSFNHMRAALTPVCSERPNSFKQTHPHGFSASCFFGFGAVGLQPCGQVWQGSPTQHRVPCRQTSGRAPPGDALSPAVAVGV